MDNILAMIKQLEELELYLTPDMNVYKNLLASGMDQMLFKQEFLSKIFILEELLYIVMNGKPPATPKEDTIKGSLGITTEILKSRLLGSDKMASTDGGFHSDYKPEAARRPIIIRRIEIGRSSVGEFESDVETPLSNAAGLLSSQRSLIASNVSLSRETAKGYIFSQSNTKSANRMTNKFAKSDLHKNSSPEISTNPSSVLDEFVVLCN